MTRFWNQTPLLMKKLFSLQPCVRHWHDTCLLLQIILALGNYMNSSKRGAVYGFKLQSLDLVTHTHLIQMCSHTQTHSCEAAALYLYLYYKGSQPKTEPGFLCMVEPHNNLKCFWVHLLRLGVKWRPTSSSVHWTVQMHWRHLRPP